MIARNFSNNFQYVPEWLWDKKLTPTEFLLYMALRSFGYPTGPTIDMLMEKTGFDRAVVEETLTSLFQAGLADPCLKDEWGQPCDDRFVFCYLKNVKGAPDQAPQPHRNGLSEQDRLRLQLARQQEKREFAEKHRDSVEDVLFREQMVEHGANLNDPNYLRTAGPINPDIVGMVDTIKHFYWTAAEQLAEMQYELAELAGLALLDPEGNVGLQQRLVSLYEDLYNATTSNVRDSDSTSDMYWDEFDNTYSDGREIKVAIRVDPHEDSNWEFNHFLQGDGAVNDFPRGTIYHINPPPRRPGMEDEL